MIEIGVRNGILKIKDQSKEIFAWNHRTFFNIGLGFTINESQSTYSFVSDDGVSATVREVVEYLTEEEIEFEVDSSISNVINSLHVQQVEFESASKNKPEVKIQKSPSFVRKLKTYQRKGLQHLLKVKHGANFSVPGSGKTSVVYAYYDQLVLSGVVNKLLVIGPYSSFSPWEEEAEKCFGHPLKSKRLVGPKRASYYIRSDEFALFLCHYQTAANDQNEIIDLLSRESFLLVVDESHYAKSFSGGVWSQALINIAPYAARRVILTGTPMPNGYRDLWSQMTILWPGKQLLGERNQYKTRIENPTECEAIKREIRPFFYRVKKSDLGLPLPKYHRLNYSLSPIQQQIYSALTIRLISDLKLAPQDRQKLRQWRKAKMVRLLQTASNPTLLTKYSDEFEVPAIANDGTPIGELIEQYSRFEIPAKFSAAIDLTRELLRSGKKVILWTAFVHNIAMLENLFIDEEVYSIHGAIPRDDIEDEEFNREKNVRNFRTSSNPCILLANPAACAESISLHKVCHDAIYLDRTFNCGQFIQSLDRIHRIGLAAHETVHYHILIANNTIDETIDRRLIEKQEAMIGVLEDELPFGGLEIEDHEMELTENEETQDFDATFADLRRFVNN